MKALVIFLILSLACIQLYQAADAETPVTAEEEFQISDAEVTTDKRVTWINSTHLIELVSYLVAQERTSQNDVIVIDTRNSDQYNGWQDMSDRASNYNETKMFTINDLYKSKNGHISFAHNLDSDWLGLFNESALNDFIEYRYGFQLRTNDTVGEGRMKDKTVPIILYDVKKERLERVKDYLDENFNLKRIYLCELDEQEMSRFVKKVNDSSLFFREPFYDMLISADALNTIIQPARIKGNTKTLKLTPILDYKLFDVSNEELKYHYGMAHIPSAVHLNTNDLETAPIFIRKNVTELAKVFLAHGIKPNNTEMIILYGNPDPMASFRAAVIMKSMGIKNIKILNGGYQAWFDRFYILDSVKSPKSSLVADIDENIALYEEQAAAVKDSGMNYIVDADYVEDLVKNMELFSNQYSLIDIRSYEEYIGEKSGYSDLKINGRIPGSFWGRAGSHPNRLEDYRNPDLSMRSGLEILKMWDDLDIDYKNKHLIFYCGNGWRSSEVLYYAEVMGMNKVSIYDGGWYDWSTKFGKLDEVAAIDENDNNADLSNNTEINSNVSISTTSQSTKAPTSTAVRISGLNFLFMVQLFVLFFSKIKN